MAVIAVTKERRFGETRVATSPDAVKKLIALGFEVRVESGAGDTAACPDAAFEAAGAKLGPLQATLAGADILLKVRAPSEAEIDGLKEGAIVVGLLNPHVDKAGVDALMKAKVSSFAMEFVPRITRAQVMDALSSQANLAGYRAVVEAAEVYGRALPMMMTAAGTVAPAKVFVMGAGVAGLQAIATARRLGAVVSATDVRPAAKEQVSSLGAKFVAVEDEEFKAAETAAGYAKPMSAEYQVKQAALISEHIVKQDIVITTALIPGRPAPRLVSSAHLKTMKPGSVVLDLAVEQGGNVEGSKVDEIVDLGGVKIVGYANLAGRIAADASALYSRNLAALIELMVDKDKGFAPDFNEEILKAALVTHGGAIVHPALNPDPARNPELT